MSSHATASLDTQLTLDPYLRTRLEKLADALGRDVSELAGAALRAFLDESERDLAAIDAGIASADRGELLDYDDVKADIRAKLAALPAR